MGRKRINIPENEFKDLWANNWTQKQIAKHFGVSQKTISNKARELELKFFTQGIKNRDRVHAYAWEILYFLKEIERRGLHYRDLTKKEKLKLIMEIREVSMISAYYDVNFLDQMIGRI